MQIKTTKTLIYLICMALILLVSCLYFVPIKWASPLLPATLQNSIGGINGNLNTGRINQITLRGKNLPLSCDYERQALNFAGTHYQIRCDKPLSITLNISADYAGQVNVTQSKLSGDIHRAKDWFALLGITETVNGTISVTIDKAIFQGRKLTYLSLNSDMPYFCLFNQPSEQHLQSREFSHDCLTDIHTHTPNAELSSNKPILLISESPDGENNKLSIQTEIDGKHYASHVIVTNNTQGQASNSKNTIIDTVVAGKLF